MSKFHTVQVAFEISTTIPLKNTASSGTFEQSPASLESGPSSNLSLKNVVKKVELELQVDLFLRSPPPWSATRAQPGN